MVFTRETVLISTTLAFCKHPQCSAEHPHAYCLMPSILLQYIRLTERCPQEPRWPPPTSRALQCWHVAWLHMYFRTALPSLTSKTLSCDCHTTRRSLATVRGACLPGSRETGSPLGASFVISATLVFSFLKGIVRIRPPKIWTGHLSLINPGSPWVRCVCKI